MHFMSEMTPPETTEQLHQPQLHELLAAFQAEVSPLQAALGDLGQAVEATAHYADQAVTRNGLTRLYKDNLLDPNIHSDQEAQGMLDVARAISPQHVNTVGHDIAHDVFEAYADTEEMAAAAQQNGLQLTDLPKLSLALRNLPPKDYPEAALGLSY